MRARIENADACDGFKDRPASLTPMPPEPRLTVNGQVLPFRPTSKHIEDHQAYLRREGDADRVIKENTARHLLGELEGEAERKGASFLMFKLLGMIEAIDRDGYEAVKARESDTISAAIRIGNTPVAKGQFARAMAAYWFAVTPADGAERERLMKNLADALP